MKIYKPQQRDPELISRLVDIWESSVRATHTFLSDGEVKRIKEYVPNALCGVAHLIVCECDSGEVVAFMGVEGERLEMLFVLPSERGAGLGGRLLKYAVENFGVREVTVNEQNRQAVGFYQHMGFKTYKRTDRDEEGGPYPLLYMKME